MTVTIRVEPSGHEFTAEAQETVLEAALRHGLAFPYGCRDGLCGSCKGQVLEGQLEYVGEPKALSELEKSKGYALFCRARPVTDMTVKVREIAGAGDMRPRMLPCRIARMVPLSHDVMGVWLKLPASQSLQYLAGQYVDVLLRDGRRRSYSMANAPHNEEFLEFHIRYVPGGAFTEQIFHQLKEKAVLRIEGPLGSFYLREESDRPLIFVAGGTGFAPIKAMLEHVFAEGIQRPTALYWGVRALRDLYMDPLPRQWAQDHPNFRYVPVLSEPAPEDQWQGRLGFVHEAVLKDHPRLSGYDVYASGPPVMVDAAREGFVARGLPLESFFSDAFTYVQD